jgi:hypothetical protein
MSIFLAIEIIKQVPTLLLYDTNYTIKNYVLKI